MNKLKTTLIHWLGGVTVEESRESDTNSWLIARLVVLEQVKGYMDSINGTPADDWCKKVYSHIVLALQSLTENGNHVEKPDTADEADA